MSHDSRAAPSTTSTAVAAGQVAHSGAQRLRASPRAHAHVTCGVVGPTATRPRSSRRDVRHVWCVAVRSASRLEPVARLGSVRFVTCKSHTYHSSAVSTRLRRRGRRLSSRTIRRARACRFRVPAYPGIPPFPGPAARARGACAPARRRRTTTTQTDDTARRGAGLRVTAQN